MKLLILTIKVIKGKNLNIENLINLFKRNFLIDKNIIYIGNRYLIVCLPFFIIIV